MTDLLPFMPVVLWTDALVFLLVAVILVFAWYVRRHEHLLAPWRKVAYSRSGMVAAVVLAVFVAVGLLDSLHFRPQLGDGAAGGKASYSVEMLSVFDVMASHLRTRPEKTYSAPLATHLFSKETVDLPDGRQARLFPRLTHGGAHLGDPETEWAWDVGKRAIAGVAIAILAWNLLVLILTIWLSQRDNRSMSDTWRQIRNGESTVPWREMLITAGLLALVLAPMLLLSAKYHVLGTDKVGQDVFYQALKSIRTGLVIGTLTTLVMLPFALLLGIMAGYLRGWVDDVIQYVYTTLNSIPGVLLIAASVLMMQVLMDKHPDLFETVQQRADCRICCSCA